MNPLLDFEKERGPGGLFEGMPETADPTKALMGAASSVGGLLAGMRETAPGSLRRAWEGSVLRDKLQEGLNTAAYFAGPHLSNRAEAVANVIPAITPKFGTEDAQAAGEAFRAGKMGRGAGLMGLGVAGGLLDALPGEAAVKGLLKGITKAAHYTPDLSMAIAPIKAFHGSPHDFDKFDIKKIGTGEGAQAYGHGLYFAGNEDVARGYRDALTNKSIPPGSGIDKAAFNIIRNAPQMSDAELVRFVRNPYPNATEEEALAALGRARQAQQPGRMYEVGIHADPETLLDWDRPLKEQSSTVRQAVGDQKLRLFPDASGKEIHDAALSRLQFGPTGMREGRAVDAKAATAQALRHAGIPGIKYFDAGSRGAGEGSRNYVTFSDDIVEILRKYGLAGAGVGLGGAMAMQPGLFPLPQQQ